MQYGLELICASVFSVICIVSARLYSLLNRAYSYWDKRGVNGPKPTYLLGTWSGFAQKFLGSEDYNNTKRYGKVFGTFDGLTPNLMITDPEIIKEILESSAENFQDARYSSENSVTVKDSLLTLCGNEKLGIQMLTNSLLNSHKLEKLIPNIESATEILIHHIIKERQEDGRLNITSSVSEFINCVIGLTIFGIDLNADIELKEEFVKNIEKIMKVKDPQSFMSLLPFFYGGYFKEFWIFPETTLQYFVNLINSVSESYTKESVLEGKSKNLIEVIKEASEEEKDLIQNDTKKGIEDLVLRDNVMISKFLAGILTLVNATRTTLLLGLYVLANNEDVQKNLHKEVENNKSEKISYQHIQSLHYLDKFIKEVMRLYPAEFRLERICINDIKIGGIELDKDVRISVPLYALHRNEDLYPEPEKFDPERFSLSSSEGLTPFSYLPFGQAGVNGSDISIKLGILTAKITLFRLVEKFKFSESQQIGLNSLFKKGFTRIPLPQEISLIAENRV